MVFYNMNQELFKQKIIQKYPNAIIDTNKNGDTIAILKENNSIKILGCSLCFDDKNVRMMDNKVVIQNIEALPITSIIEDDSLNPLMKALFLCPICGRIITHPDISNRTIMGRTIEEWKD